MAEKPDSIYDVTPKFLGELESWLLQHGFKTTFPPATPAAVSYRKTTAKPVNTTTSATDLLNGEVSVAAGAMGATGGALVTAWGDWKNNSGGAVAPPRFQLILGSSTLFDTGTSGGTCTNAATRYGWKIVVEILNTSASAQVANFLLTMSAGVNLNGDGAFTTGEGNYVLYTPSARGFGFGEAYNTSAENTATAKTLVLNVINGSANAAYETNLAGAVIQIV